MTELEALITIAECLLSIKSAIIAIAVVHVLSFLFKG